MKHLRTALVIFCSAAFMLGCSQSTKDKASEDVKAVSDATKKAASDAADASKQAASDATDATTKAAAVSDSG